MSQEKLQEVLSNILIGTGTTSTGLVFWSNFDLGLGIFLKIVSLLSFFCFILINQDKIEEGWKKLITRLYNNLPFINKKKNASQINIEINIKEENTSKN